MENKILGKQTGWLMAAILAVTLAQAAPDAEAKAKAAAPKYTAAQLRGLDMAVDAFNHKEYSEALSQFEKLDRNGMCCEKVHYYIGRCCQQLSQVQRAKDNYAWVATKGKDPTLRYYAEVAYAQMEHYSQHRTYQGNGNVFVGSRGGGGRSGGGGGPMISLSGAKFGSGGG